MSEPVPLIYRLLGPAARLLDRLPGPLQVALSLRRPVVVDGQRLDPGLQALLALRPEKRDLTDAAIPEARARLRNELIPLPARPTPVGPVRDLLIDGAEGPIEARHYAPPDGARSPLTVFYHGGGFVLGDLDTHDEVCRILCRETGHHVLSVGYRLSPEHKFPAPLDDTVAAFRWAVTHAADLGADRGRVAVAGDSAGGTLAAVVCLLTRGGPVRPAAQLLIYPATDRSREWRSAELFSEGLLLSRADRDRYFEWYSGGTGTDPADPRLSPLQARDLSGLPPALSVVAGFDVLRDEGLAYAEALARAGTVSEVHLEPGLGHGFVNLAPVNRASRRALFAVAARWRELVS